MIKVNVLSEEKSWNRKLKKKEIFFNNYVNFFQKNLDFLIKKFI